MNFLAKIVRFLLKDTNRNLNLKENECVLTKSNTKKGFFNERSYVDIISRIRVFNNYNRGFFLQRFSWPIEATVEAVIFLHVKLRVDNYFLD